MGTNTAKPYKIQEANGSRRIGITAESMQDLRRKAVKRLNITDNYRLCLEDGTEVLTEEYFKSLPPQTCFTFLNDDEETGSLESDLLRVEKLTKKITRKLNERHTAAIEDVKKLLTEDNSETVNRALLDYLSSLESSANIELETRAQDETWFDGLAKKFQTKDAVMRAGAQSRIRNYYHKTKEYVLDQNGSKMTRSLVEIFHQTLRSNEYHGDYFVRSADQNIRICDELGWFKCQGTFNSNACLMRHSINPYGSREARIVFSTWNLDHVIEKSREVFPSFVKAAESCPKNVEVNWKYFYELLFTKKNLKLVHVACHIKGIHSGKKCNKNMFYSSKSTVTKTAKHEHLRISPRSPKRSPRR